MYSKILNYLEKKDIDFEEPLPEETLSLDENGDILMWGFNIEKPNKEDLEEKETQEEEQLRQDKKDFKAKIKTLRQQQITILKKKEFDKMKEQNLFQVGDVFISQNKLYIITNDKPLQSYPNVI